MTKVTDFLKGVWDALDIVKLLAIAFVALFAYQVVKSMTIDETLKNIVIAIVSFYFGSSMGSKAKEAAMIGNTAPPTPVQSPKPPAGQ